MRSTSSGSACARSLRASGSAANSAGVTLLTFSSVVCAERIVAASSWNAFVVDERALASGYSSGEPLAHDLRPRLRPSRPRHPPNLRARRRTGTDTSGAGADRTRADFSAMHVEDARRRGRRRWRSGRARCPSAASSPMPPSSATRLDGGVGVVHREVHRPERRHLGGHHRRLLHHPADRTAADLPLGVLTRRPGAVRLGGPPEHLAVEALRRLDVGGEELAPGPRARLVDQLGAGMACRPATPRTPRRPDR